MTATMKDIARVAGVSRQAVAAALNDAGTSKVSTVTRERIRRIADSMHFVPNQTAQRLKGIASNTIGIYGVPYASVLMQSFFNDLSVELDRHGYNLMACYGMTEKASEQAIRRLLAKGIDGMIVTTQENPLARMSLPAIPAVFCPPARIDGYDVAVDHAAGTRTAARQLLAAGRKRVVYLPPCFLGGVSDRPNLEKFRGIREALAEAGLQPTLLTVEECSGEAEILLERLHAIAPDVVFCSNDYFAGRLISLLLEAGIAVPEEMMVVGYDGLSMCDLCAVPLATVVQPMQKMAEIAVKLLLERIAAKGSIPAPAGIDLEPYFYASTSCGVANSKRRKLPLYNSYSSLEAIWNNEF